MKLQFLTLGNLLSFKIRAFSNKKAPNLSKFITQAFLPDTNSFNNRKDKSFFLNLLQIIRNYLTYCKIPLTTLKNYFINGNLKYSYLFLIAKILFQHIILIILKTLTLNSLILKFDAFQLIRSATASSTLRKYAKCTNKNKQNLTNLQISLSNRCKYKNKVINTTNNF